MADSSLLDDENMNINRKLNVFKHIKKKAANDAQLLMNRIALIQKEEERARKKIEQTKEKAAEIIALRTESEKRVQMFSSAAGHAQQIQQIQMAKNRELDMEGRKNRAKTIEALKIKKKDEVTEILMEKKFLTQQMIKDQEEEIRLKQLKRDEIKRMEQEQKQRKEEERMERERKVREMYEQKLLEEAAEAKRAEKIVKALEKKEREWIEKLREAQTVQEMAFEQLETALVKDGVAGGSGGGAGGAAGPLSAGSSMSSMHGPPRYEEASPAASPPRPRPGPHSPPTLDDRDRDRQTAARRGSGSGSVGKLPLPAGKKKGTGPRK